MYLLYSETKEKRITFEAPYALFNLAFVVMVTSQHWCFTNHTLDMFNFTQYVFSDLHQGSHIRHSDLLGTINLSPINLAFSDHCLITFELASYWCSKPSHDCHTNVIHFVIFVT